MRLIYKVTSLPWSDYALLKSKKGLRNRVQLLPNIFQQEIPSEHTVRSEARSAGEWRALKRGMVLPSNRFIVSKSYGEAMALCIWSCVCSGCGDDPCRKPIFLFFFVLIPQTLHASLCRNIMSLVWSGNYVPMTSSNFVSFSVPSLYKTDLNQKRKISYVFILLTQFSP